MDIIEQNQKNEAQISDEFLDHLELLMNYEILQEEENWEIIEKGSSPQGDSK